jgi:putative ABC transport system permease protein
MGRIDWDEVNRRPNLTIEDAEAIARMPGVERVAPTRSRQVNKITWRSNKVTDIELAGATPAYSVVANHEVDVGRFINSEDSLRRHSVCVIGGYIVDNLFPNEDPMGKRLTIDGKTYTIVGILARKGSFLGQSQDNVIIVPLSTFEKDYSPSHGYGELMYQLSIGVKPKNNLTVDQLIDQLRELMRRRHGLGYDKPDDFGINTQDTLRDIYRNITRVAYIVMVAVAAISLLVGGIGIMNIMLVAVAERTREIGLRKALGATNQDVLWQFLLEATMLAVVGGIAGLLLGIGIAKLIEVTAHLHAAAPFWVIAVGIGFSAGVGIFFGIYPASRAARLNPIEALRYE